MPKLDCLEEHSANFENFVVYAQFIELYNGYLLMVTDQIQYGIGTIALSSPPSEISNQSLSSPFNLFGFKHTLLANLLGKTASKLLKKPVMTMILIKDSSIKPKIIMEIATKAVHAAINSILDKKKTNTRN